MSASCFYVAARKHGFQLFSVQIVGAAVGFSLATTPQLGPDFFLRHLSFNSLHFSKFLSYIKINTNNIKIPQNCLRTNKITIEYEHIIALHQEAPLSSSSSDTSNHLEPIEMANNNNNRTLRELVTPNLDQQFCAFNTLN